MDVKKKIGDDMFGLTVLFFFFLSKLYISAMTVWSNIYLRFLAYKLICHAVVFIGNNNDKKDINVNKFNIFGQQYCLKIIYIRRVLFFLEGTILDMR